ncbi:UNVERIFIED_CONTAM: putative pectate lyase 2 [Sesamum calycinum]|uniref:Pectate lyase 2 n=1 Tax=Sesamum calycinum TaxID=2727403 RepID=A0AAW2Q667_9LAMI
MVMALAIPLLAEPTDHQVERPTYDDDEDFPVSESAEPNTSLRGASRFLAQSLSTFTLADSYYYTPSTNKNFMNSIDSCWRARSNWATNRRALADCAVGFGKNAIGGKFGATYLVTDASDDPVNQNRARSGMV